MLLLAAFAMQTIGLPTKDDFRAWGKEAVELTRAAFFMPDKRLYGEEIVPGQPPKQVSFNWGCGVWLSALNAATEADARYGLWLREFAEESRRYWNTEGPVPGYDVLPMPKSADRYYDDNEWMALALVETYERLHDPKYLRWAGDTLRFVMSGEDQSLGGGIYWREREKSSKNTCSNAPAAAACLAIYRYSHNPGLLAKARELYGWTKKNLQDPEDYLMGDSIRLDGHKEMTKWSYNTALMIRTAAELYRVTNEPGYRLDALNMAAASASRWLHGGRLEGPGKFAHLLVEAWLILDRDVPGAAIPRRRAGEALAYLHDHARSPEGFYPDPWGDGPLPPNRKAALIDQASFARACFELAR